MSLVVITWILGLLVLGYFITHEFENGSKDMDRIESLELIELANLKRTEIIKWKIEFEKRINEMELIDLYYLNVRI